MGGLILPAHAVEGEFECTAEEIVLCTANISSVAVVVTETGPGFTQFLWKFWNQSTIAPTFTLSKQL
jgi:hypothetical protein